MQKENPSASTPVPSDSLSVKEESTPWARMSIVLLVLVWYTANIGVVLLNKFILSFYGFKYPIFLTLLHMALASILSLCTIGGGWIQPQYIQSRRQLLKICLLSAVFAAAIILGNVSLRHIPVSFNQAIGATTPFFTAVLSFILQGRQESACTYLSLVPVVAGIVIATGFEPSFDFLGFTACLLSTLFRAFKTVLQAILLTEPSEKMNSMNLLLYMAPISTLMMVPTVLVLEPTSIGTAWALATSSSRFVHLILANCLLAFGANLFNFLLTKQTCALTLQVLGNAKGVVATVISVVLFRNIVTVMGSIGYGVTIIGVMLYSHNKNKHSPKSPSQGVDSSDKNGRLQEALSEEPPSINGRTKSGMHNLLTTSVHRSMSMPMNGTYAA